MGQGWLLPSNRDELWTHVFLLQNTKRVSELTPRLGPGKFVFASTSLVE